MKIYRFGMMLGVISGLLGCIDQSPTHDLEVWMNEGFKDVRGKVDELPSAKPYEPFVYNDFSMPDPFKPRKVSSPVLSGTIQPDMNRPRQLLENYPLESLIMVGVLERKKVRYGVVKANDNTLHQVKIGNYMGQNFGHVIGITDSEIKLKELVQNVNSEWVERETNVQLIDAQQENKK